MRPTPVLEIGGTHVTGALVDPDSWRIVEHRRLTLDADGSADEIMARFVEAAGGLDAPRNAVWGVAMPDPFDYESGVGRFEGVGKFAALNGVDVRSALTASLGPRPAQLHFVNDADAFVLGEWTAGAARGVRRCAGVTLGTGVGSGWLVDGRPVEPGLPPGGRIHRMTVGGVPLEDIVSRRAIRRAFVASGGDPTMDVREIASAARDGDETARRVLERAFRVLGEVVGRCVEGFDADVLVVGGSMAGSWAQLEPSFRAGAARRALPEIRLAADSDTSALVGAAASVPPATHPLGVLAP